MMGGRGVKGRREAKQGGGKEGTAKEAGGKEGGGKEWGEEGLPPCLHRATSHLNTPVLSLWLES